MFVLTSQGSPYARFRRALASGNPLLVRAAAAELPRVDLADALRIVYVMRLDEARFERAGVRWIGRFCVEAADVTLEDVQEAASALSALGLGLPDGVQRLVALCRDHGVARV